MSSIQLPWKWLAVGLVVVGAGALVATARGGDEIEVSIPAGTTIVAALESTVSTEKADVGDRVALRIAEPIAVGDALVPEGGRIQGEVTHAKGGGRIAGAPELTLRFTRITLNGAEYPLGADPFRVKGKSHADESALQIGGGTVVGGVVGAIAGDPVKGAVVGAVIGTGVAVATKGDQLVLPAGQKLRLRTSESLTVRVPRTSDSE